MADPDGIDVYAAAERGADLLDVEMPGWAERVDLKTFDLNGGGNDILTQIGINYTDLVKKWNMDLSRSEDHEYGLDTAGDDEDLMNLEIAWGDEIRARKKIRHEG